MEIWQKDHIRKNLPNLLKDTVCSSSLFASLYADGVVSDEELGILESIRNRHEQAKKLYEIIQTRKDSYNLLRQALKDTAQTGILAVLDQCNQHNVDIPFKNYGTISYFRSMPLGRGCFGTQVFKGKLEYRDVAVKRINIEDVELALALKEVEFLSKLDSHPNVVRYYRTEVTDDFVFIALELCDVNLSDWVNQQPRMVAIDLVEIIRQAAQGVAHLHSNRIVHRDLKPTNILLLSRVVGVPQVKISDFGVSKILHLGLSRLGGHTTGVGTEDWMAPEVAGGNLTQKTQTLTFASDIFSLGCIYYFVLTEDLHPFGVPPFCQVNILEGKSILQERKVAALDGNTSGFIGIISKMIVHEQSERPSVFQVLNWLPDVEQIEFEEVDSGITHGMEAMRTSTDEDGKGIEDELHLAIKRGDLKAIIHQIKMGADVNAINDNSKTPIFQAATLKVDANTVVKIVKCLVDSGADVFNTDTKGHSFLHKLASTESALTSSQFHDIAVYLSKKNLYTLFNIPDLDHGSTPLMLAAANAKLEPKTLSLLHHNNIDFTLLDQNGKSVLFYMEQGSVLQKWLANLLKLRTLKLEEAIEAKDEKLVELLVKLGADVNGNQISNFTDTPLYKASVSSDKDFAFKTIQLLIEQNADTKWNDAGGQTFLHQLFLNATTQSSSGFGAFAQFLVDKGLSALFNAQDTASGITPFMLAAKNVEVDMAAMYVLERSGVDVKLVDANGSCFILYAVEGIKNTKLLTELKENGFVRQSKLELAIKECDMVSVRVLVRLGANVNEEHKNSETPLHLAAMLENKAFAINVIKFLINSGANVDAKDGKTFTFLHVLVLEGATISPVQFHDIVAFLISKNVSRLFNTRSHSGYTPFQWAVQNVEMETATLALLKNNRMDFNAVNGAGWSILFFATVGNRTARFIADLVELGANPYSLSKTKHTMLHMAARNGNLEVLKFFLDKGLDVDAQNDTGDTPLYDALFNSSSKENVFPTVQFLMQNGANKDITNRTGKSPPDHFNQMRGAFPDADKISACFSHGAS